MQLLIEIFSKNTEVRFEWNEFKIEKCNKDYICYVSS